MLIGLSGKMGTGKSTVANYLMEKEKDSAVVKIAGLLYELQDMIYSHLGMKLDGEKDRPLLVAVGMWGRDKDENFWTEKAINKAVSLPNKLVLIDDIRFPNEAKAIESAGGILIRIEGLQRGPNITEEYKTNITETALDDYPFKHRVHNLGSVDLTLSQVQEILNKYK
jgi:ABC-type oligopeptide transport system ATPase subunit